MIGVFAPFGAPEVDDEHAANRKHIANAGFAGANRAAPDTSSLRRVLARAADQAETGKGAERHSNGEPFERQKICEINRWLGSPDGAIFQAVKKAVESKRLPRERAVAELLGAINYLAAAVILVEESACEGKVAG